MISPSNFPRFHEGFLWLLLACCLSLPLFPQSQARWANFNEATVTSKKSETTYEVRADGRYEVTEEEEIQILKEEARSRFGTQRIIYNSRAEKVEVVFAETRDAEGKVHPVSLDLIQDKPLASSREGFDQMNQVSIAFPEVSVGSTIRVKTRRKFEEPPFPGFFGTQLIFGSPEPEENSHVRIVSEQPLVYEAHDPRSLLKIKQTSDSIDGKKVHVLDIRQTKPEFRKVSDETDPYLPGSAYTWVNVASHSDWAALAAPLLPEYEKRLSEPLPPLFEKIRKLAAKEKNTAEKIDRVTERLAEELHYWADWRPIRGGHIPRPLATIAASRFGDCKDFTLATTAILRSLRIEAFPAWIKREYRPVFSPNHLPYGGAFNHAIVRVKSAQDDYWIDPTNKISFATGIFEDIIDRPALVLYQKAATLEHVPAAQPDSAVVKIRIKKELGNSKRPTIIHGELSLTGRRAAPFTGEHLNKSHASTDLELVHLFSDEGKALEWKLSPYDLTSRIVRPLSFQFEIREEGSPAIQSTAGDGLPLPSSAAARKILNISKDRVSDLFLGQPYLTQKETLLIGVLPVGQKNLRCEVNSPWLRLKRDIERTPEGTLVREEFATLKPALRLEETQTNSFKDFLKQLRSCAEGKVLIYEPVKST